MIPAVVRPPWRPSPRHFPVPLRFTTLGSAPAPTRLRCGGLFVGPTDQVPHAFARAHAEPLGDAIEDFSLRTVETQYEVSGSRSSWARAYFHLDGLTNGSTFVNLFAAGLSRFWLALSHPDRSTR